MEQVLDVKAGIFVLKYLKDGTLALMDQNSTLRVLNAETFKTIGGFKAKLVHEHRILNIMDISYTGSHALIGIPKKHKAALFASDTKKLQATIGLHKGEIETVAISDDGRYLATGGTDGRSFVYHASSSSAFISLMPRSDYITSIAFSPDSSLIAYGSFDRIITVKNIDLMSEEFLLKAHSSAIKQLLFISSQLLVSTDKDGSLIVWDLHERKVKVRMTNMLEEILSMTLSADKHFLFVGTIYGNIGLYNLENFECVTNSYLKVQGRVNALAIAHKEKVLFYGTQEGTLFQHSLMEGEDDLRASLDVKDYKNAYAQLDQNILLKFSENFKILEETWEKSLLQAKQLFGKDLADTAISLLEPFSEVKGKRTIIKKVIEEFHEFYKFKTYAKEGKFALAYSLAGRYKLYEETPEYEELESQWEKQFLKAKQSILAGSGEEQAREHLAPFRGVTQKAKLISELYNQSKVYILFRHKFVQKDYSFVFKLVEQYPFLGKFKEFRDLKMWSDIIYMKIHEAYVTQDYLSAIKYAHLIKDFPDFKAEISSLIEHSQVYIDFKQALTSRHIEKVYELLEKNSFLADLPAIKGMDPQWDSILEQINILISTGNMTEVLALLKPYKHPKYKKRHMISFIKSTYIKQLELALENDEPMELIKKGFLKMYDIFGKDDLFMILVKNYEKAKNTTVDFSHTKPGNLLIFDIDHMKTSIFD